MQILDHFFCLNMDQMILLLMLLANLVHPAIYGTCEVIGVVMEFMG